MTAEDRRCADFIVFGFRMEFIPEFQQCLTEYHAFSMEEREARAFFVEAEEIHLLAQFAMITFFCFFQHVEIVFQFRFLFESCPINTLEHLVVFITAPVRACYSLQLKGLDSACRSCMRPSTEVNEVALAIEGNLHVCGQILNQFYFVILTGFLEHIESSVTADYFFFEGQIFLDDSSHFRFDSRKIFLCKAMFCIHIVVEAIFNGRANSKFDAREEVLNGLRHNMGSRMT